jgi:hypothetical protein
MPEASSREPARPSALRRWLRRHSLTIVAALGGAAGVAYAASWQAERAHASGALIGPALAGLHQPGPAAEPARDTAVDTVQIALLLDTSSSMDGLINQARSHLWAIVDRMGQMTRVVDGKVRGVRVELALYEYGNSRLAEKGGYIRQVMPFTSDLDKVAEQLQSLVTNGGEEYAGQAIQQATSELAWSKDRDALRFVFVAGNESFNQGPISAELAMKAAKSKDISVQLIECGETEATWTHAAMLAGTDLTSIDQDRVAAHIAAPQDADILRLGGELNGTYLAYGADGAAAVARQAAADASSAKLSPKVALERSQLKAKKAYKNSSWDIIDKLEDDANFLAKADEGSLPVELRGKSLAEKQQLVAAQAAKRAALKAEIARLEAERMKFLEAERAKTAPDAPSLETELVKGTRKIAGAKGWKL